MVLGAVADLAGCRGREGAVKSFVKSKCFKGTARGPGASVVPSQGGMEQDPAPSRALTALELLVIFVSQACPHYRQLEYLPTGMELLLSKEICAL